MPFNFSNLLAGGIFKSLKHSARFNIYSFLRAIRCISYGIFLNGICFQIFSVSLSLNDRIIIEMIMYDVNYVN